MTPPFVILRASPVILTAPFVELSVPLVKLQTPRVVSERLSVEILPPFVIHPAAQVFFLIPPAANFQQGLPRATPAA
ncbi:MAG TPA: hypothetical protein VIK35_04210 [Verrucomicrobiae bacterium]